MKSDNLSFVFFTILSFFLPVSISISQMLTAFFVFFALFKIFKRERIDFSCFPHPILLFLFMVFPLISFINAENIVKALTWYKRHLYIVILPVLTAYFMTIKEKKDVLLKAFLFGASASSVAAILQPFFGLNFDKPFKLQTYYVFATGFFSHPLTYSETTSFAVMLCLYFFFKTSGQKQKAFYLFLFALNFLGLIFSREKTPFLAVILISIVYSAIYLQRKGNLKKAAIVILLLLLIPAAIPNKKKILWRFQKEKIKFSIETRAKIWGKSIKEFTSHPIAGIGFGNYLIKVEKWNKKGFVTLFHAHNNFFEILSTTGLIGIIIFSLFHLAIFKDFLLSLKKGKDFLFYLTLFSIFLLYHIEGLTECTFKDTELNLQLFFFLSLFYSSLCPLIKDKHKAGKDK